MRVWIWLMTEDMSPFCNGLQARSAACSAAAAAG